jgi:hypothetical protein
VGASFKEHSKGVPDGFNIYATLDLSIDSIQDQGVQDHEGKIFVIGPALSRCEAIDITNDSVIKGDCVTNKVI